MYYLTYFVISDNLSSSSGVSSQPDEPLTQILNDLDLPDNIRLFVACKNCYHLKPPIVIQIGKVICSFHVKYLLKEKMTYKNNLETK